METILEDNEEILDLNVVLQNAADNITDQKSNIEALDYMKKGNLTSGNSLYL